MEKSKSIDVMYIVPLTLLIAYLFKASNVFLVLYDTYIAVGIVTITFMWVLLSIVRKNHPLKWADIIVASDRAMTLGKYLVKNIIPWLCIAFLFYRKAYISGSMSWILSLIGMMFHLKNHLDARKIKIARSLAVIKKAWNDSITEYQQNEIVANNLQHMDKMTLKALFESAEEEYTKALNKIREEMIRWEP